MHRTDEVNPRAAAMVVRELHHVMVWAAFHHSPHPELAPTAAEFDPALAPTQAPLSHEELVKLAERIQRDDEAHARELAQREDLLREREAEIAQLQSRIAEAQQAYSLPDTRDYDEATTRRQLIDVLLAEAGWDLQGPNDVEYPVDGMPDGRSGRVDYVLWGNDGLPLAVVEAKRTTRSVHDGQRQAELYADAVQARFGRRPVIFYTNGVDHYLWDDAQGYPPRRVAGFFTRDELELMIQRRDTRRPLTGYPVTPGIADRAYQQHAVKTAGEAFDAKQRDALWVMATGTGKTRTVISLVDQMIRAGWVKRVLFLADRTALVRQATAAFQQHLPSEATVNLVADNSAEGRIYVSTYPTMLNLVNRVENGRRRFGPGHFDLVIIDEAHRSVYARYGALFEYFDALLVGLTATPVAEIDRNTYRLFHLEDGMPTAVYALNDAVEEKNLVPPRSIAVTTKFLDQGVHYDDLSEDEKAEWDAADWGDGGPPVEVNREGLNRFLFNEDTVDKVLATLMDQGIKVAGGDRLGKTIIFAKTQAHAEFVEQRFNELWPDQGGRFARVITHNTAHADSLIEDFSDPQKAPHIAISVDMLDTGIDVPDVVNLVFFKTVHSKTKFWQMIGRGTRLREDLFGPGQHKECFAVFDFCGNLEYFKQNLPEREGSVQRSLTQRLVEHRITLLERLGDEDADLRRTTADDLCAFVSGMNLDNVLVRPHRRAVERFVDRDEWDRFGPEAAAEAMSVAGLPSEVRDTDEDAKRFDLVVLRLQLAQLEGDAKRFEALREVVQGVADGLLAKTTIPSVAAQATLLEAVLTPGWWQDVTLALLEDLRLRVRGLVGFLERTRRNPVYSDFEDDLGEAREVDLPGVTPGTDFERFRERAQAYLRSHQDNVALQRLRRNRQLTDSDWGQLTGMLREAGAQDGDLERVRGEDGGLGVFIRNLVGLEPEVANAVFAEQALEVRWTSTQMDFVGLIISELTSRGVVEPSRLYEPPYTDMAPLGPRALFPEAEVIAIYDVLDEVRSRAVAAG